MIASMFTEHMEIALNSRLICHLLVIFLNTCGGKALRLPLAK